MAFRGQFDYSLDAKNRLNVPPKFRAALSEGLVLSKHLDPCIAIWTPEKFEAISGNVSNERNPLNPDYREVMRYFTHNAWDADLDASGRVTLNAKLLEHAGIAGRAVVVAGTDDHVEVWDPDRWQAHQEQLGSSVIGIAEGFGHSS